MAITSIGRYAVKSATLTFGSASYEVASMPVGKCASREAVEVTALGDEVKRYIPGALLDYDEFQVSLYMKPSGNIEPNSAPAALSISVSLENGGGSQSASVSFPTCLVTKVSYPSIEATGDRKAIYEVTFKPDGSSGSAS